MMRYVMVLAMGLTILVGASAVGAEKCDLPLVYEDDFEKGADGKSTAANRE